MAKSPRFPPGDSAPDFSHLADHDPESDEPQWQPGGDSSDPPADDDETDPAATDPAVGDSHVFFEADEPVSEDEMMGETTAYTPVHQRRSDSTDDRERAGQLDETDADSVLEGAADSDDPSLGVSASNATQLTDVGIPVFEDLPGVSKADADDAVEVPSPAGADEPAAEAPPATAPHAAPHAAPEIAPVDRRPIERAPALTGASAGNDRQRLLLIVLASYASAITIAFVWLWLARSTAQPHELESLPDVAPLGPNEFRYAPQNASMPPGHTLPLGDEQQLGYIKVEPLRVTRAPVKFAHYSDPMQSKSPTEPVLKLWLRFTNVSSDQLIAPLDANLLLTRSYQVEADTVLANQLLLPADKSSQKPAFVIDHPTTSEWDLAGQKLGHRLAPGESLETYIPLEPGSESHLQGDLLWRVHFRKGYHDATGHGVTTMIEVPFSIADVQTESETS